MLLFKSNASFFYRFMFTSKCPLIFATGILLLTNPGNIGSMLIMTTSQPTVHIKVDCKQLVIRARSNTWSFMLLPLPLDDDNQIYIRTCFTVESQNTTVKLDRIEYYSRQRQTRRSQNILYHSISSYIIHDHEQGINSSKL